MDSAEKRNIERHITIYVAEAVSASAICCGVASGCHSLGLLPQAAVPGHHRDYLPQSERSPSPS
jgi:hypothetical protein